MKKQFIILLASFLILAPLVPGIHKTLAQSWYQTAEQRIDTLRKGNFTLRITDTTDNPYVDSVIIQHSLHEFPWGNTVGIPNETSDWKWQQSALLKYYNYGVVEHFKWPYIEGSEGNINYAFVDSSYAWAERVGWELRAHTLIWGGSQSWQMPGWTLTPSKTAEEVYEACETHIRREVNRYKGTIKEYDVVNEPIHETWLANKVGDSINWNSFIWADEEDPDARLFINDFNIIVWGSTQDFILKIQELMDHGAPIDGIGVQGHMEGRLNWMDIKTKLDVVGELGLPIKVTEFDMKIDEQGTPDEDMAEYYAMMMRICFSHPAVEGLIWWGFKDPTYRNGSGIFNEDRSPKIAADTVYHLIHEKWTTRIEGKTAPDGTITFKGFFGDYIIRVKIGDEWLIVPVSCLKINDQNEIAVNLRDAEPEIPRMIYASHNEAGTVLYVTFDQEMQDPSVGANAFNLIAQNGVEIASATLNPENAAIAELTLSNPLRYDTYYALTSEPGNIQSIKGVHISWDGPVDIYSKIPGFVSAQTNETGDEIEITLSEAISDPSASVDNFTLMVNGKETVISAFSLKTGYDSIVLLTLSSPVVFSDVIYVSYNRGTLIGMSGYYFDNFTNRRVENLVPSAILENKNETIRVFPNPFSDNLIIKTDHSTKIESATIFDQTGRELKKIFPGTDEATKMNTSEFKKGIYFLNVAEISGTVHTIKLFKL